jgi:hypothetical protein
MMELALGSEKNRPQENHDKFLVNSAASEGQLEL